MKRVHFLASCLALVALSGLPACADTVGTKNAYDASKITQDNPSPSSIVQISPGEEGGSTTVNTIGPVHQTFVDATTGNIKTIGGGVAGKTIALPTGGGKFLLVSSQDDATFEASEIYDGASGKVIAKGVKITTNVSDPTKASAEAIKTWGPFYIDALKEARAGNTEKYNAVCNMVQAVAPAALEAMKLLYGVP